MTGAFVIIALVAAIVAVLVVHTHRIIRAERGQKPGQAPGEGDYVFEVTYASGLGGGQTAVVRVPRDPQAYARQFVPRDQRKKDEP
ncbi:MAG: hypothetical protein JKP98_20585 [Rhodobacteraceae bacterium]|jgi:hypothetical protein|nr:hypothetical protein [Paracoccaceae bacterium]MBL4558597.1 hypothetical protein [Paracoccaceae bacterium]HBG99701.1 hypothetical protein [Paracoccaceae bacterium]